MIRAELIKRSPIRILERSTHGGLTKGGFGVFTGPKGVGKTACLVHLATDRLLQDRHVVHISFAADTAHIVAWYEDIFDEIAERYQLDGAMGVHDSIIRNRVITNFAQSEVHWDRVEKTIRSLKSDGGFVPDTVVVDGYDFAASDNEAFKGFKRTAAELGLEVWFSGTMAPAGNSLGALDGDFEVIISLVDKGDHINLELVKDHGNPVENCHLKLDPQILLIAEES